MYVNRSLQSPSTPHQTGAAQSCFPASHATELLKETYTEQASRLRLIPFGSSSLAPHSVRLEAIEERANRAPH
ncbi:hypothetical protein E2C01_074336 [Portunus trituberculatus]|uniref:Uncharacterized protein n=1 Tax=Portunus trituberculatus TaxID=210409 RepID=A0A5B7I5F3_PORTR|nr:hypothetical protein [Portunus trituberculatus]